MEWLIGYNEDDSQEIEEYLRSVYISATSSGVALGGG